MSTIHSDPQIRKLINEYLKLGWTVDQSGKHLKLFTPDGRYHVSMSRSPSCGHAYKNIKRDLEKLNGRYAKDR